MILLSLSLNPLPYSRSSGQTPPAYPELYRDPARTDQLTPADLPNLGRQVVLEATSMFVHVTVRAGRQPGGLSSARPDQGCSGTRPTRSWRPSPRERPASQALEAGCAGLPDLEAAFERVRATMGVVAG